MKTVFFLIGPPGSGKSTWRAKYLSKTKRPTTIISSDDMIDKYAEQHGMTYSEAFKVVSFNAINTSITQNYKSALERGDDVIIDRTNMNAKSRKNFLDMVPSDYKKCAVIFSVPREELQKRLDQRAEKTGKSIPQNVVDSMLASYVEPSKIDFDEIVRV